MAITKLKVKGIGKLVIIALVFVGLLSAGSYGIYTLYKGYDKTRNETSQESHTIRENLLNLQNKITNLQGKVTQLEEDKETIQNKLWACTTYIKMYQIFYEKADELFANGISGCAIRYINSGRPNELPEGCYRWNATKKKYPYVTGEWFEQDPDQKYYNSISALYREVLKFQSMCEQ
ncbi:MAG: hypothetical protein ABIB98_01350 [bacterium]